MLQVDGTIVARVDQSLQHPMSAADMDNLMAEVLFLWGSIAVLEVLRLRKKSLDDRSWGLLSLFALMSCFEMMYARIGVLLLSLRGSCSIVFRVFFLAIPLTFPLYLFHLPSLS